MLWIADRRRRARDGGSWSPSSVAPLLIPAIDPEAIPLPGVAPLLGLVGLGPVYPALAGLTRGGRGRALLGAVGYLWLAAWEELAHRTLLLGPIADPPAHWTGVRGHGHQRRHRAAVRRHGARRRRRLGAAAAGPAALIRGRTPVLDALGALIWAAGLISALRLVAGGASPPGLLFGACWRPSSRPLLAAGVGPHVASRGRLDRRATVAMRLRSSPATSISPAACVAGAPISRSLPISVLRNLEARIEGLVEGVFSRAFSSGVQPVEIARKLAKEMDAHKTASVQRVYVPNEYTVWLCPDDYERFKDYESSLAQELSGHLLEHARHHDYDLLTRPGGQPRPGRAPAARRVRDPDPPGPPAAAPGRRADAGRARPHDGLLGDPGAEGALQAAPRRRLLGDPRDRLRSTTAATSSTGRPRRSGAPRSATASSTTPTSRAGTPSCGARASATGRSSTSARPTGSRSTAAASPTPASRPATRSRLGTNVFTFDIEQ